MVFLYILALFWFLRTGKAVLFWLYLWQLKEYHIGRFIDHFRTTKGRQIFLNPLFFFKLFLLGALFIVVLGGTINFVPWYEIDGAGIATGGLFVLYLFEIIKVGFDVLKRRILHPAWTEKTRLLAVVSFALIFAVPAILFIWRVDAAMFVFWLLFLDVFLHKIISLMVLGLQPIAVLGRRRIIAKAKRKRAVFSNLLVVGITGSYGKTSTKEFLALILQKKFHVLKTKEHQNSEVGVAQCILNDLRPEHEVFIAEMGAYGKGGIKLLCDIVKPKIGIITGVNEQHLALFGSMENLLSAEGGGELFEALSEEGMVVVNWDNQYIMQNAKCKMQNDKSKCKIIKYSATDKEDVWAEDVRIEKEYVSFRAVAKYGDAADFKVNVLGAHFVPNILAATSVAKELGMTMAEIAEQCKKITPELAGMTMRKGINGATIIDSTYSANPDGVIAHLEYLKVWPGRKAIIMPCLIELGKASKEVHRRIGRKIGEVCDLAIITTKEHFNDIKSGTLEAGMENESILFLGKPHQIFEKVKDAVGTEDVVLLEGRLPKALIKMFEK